MKLAHCVEIYVERKRLCGYDYHSSARVLRRFANSVGKIDISFVTEQHINAFLRRGRLSHNMWRNYRAQIRRFLAYWFGRRQIRRIPEPEQKPAVPTRFFPYVYSRAEIGRLLEAASICQARRRCLMSPNTLRTIILFLYGTALRVKEALALTDSDVHFDQGLIEIFPGSLYRHRTIPMGTDVRRLLRQFLRSKERAPFGTGHALFLGTMGQPVQYSLLMEAFQRLRTCARVVRPNSPVPARLQDLRHTFAVHSINSWAERGWSYEKMMPMLMSYMGIVREKGFLRYFELTPSRFRSQLASLIIRNALDREVAFKRKLLRT